MALRRRLQGHEKVSSFKARTLKQLVHQSVVGVMEAKLIARGKNAHANHGRTLPYYAPILDAMSRFSESFSGKKILHLGSSASPLCEYLQAQGAQAAGFDINRNSLSVAKNAGLRRVVQGDARTHLPFRTHSFDFVVSDHFLLSRYEGLSREDAAPAKEVELEILRNTIRVIKKGGFLVLAEFSEGSAGWLRTRLPRLGLELVYQYSRSQGGPDSVWVLQKKA